MSRTGPKPMTEERFWATFEIGDFGYCIAQVTRLSWLSVDTTTASR